MMLWEEDSPGAIHMPPSSPSAASIRRTMPLSGSSPTRPTSLTREPRRCRVPPVFGAHPPVETVTALISTSVLGV